MNAINPPMIGGSPASSAPPASTPGIGSTVAGYVGSAVTSTLFSSRVIAIVLGLICITGSILLYLGDDIAGAIGVGGKAVSKVGALAA